MSLNDGGGFVIGSAIGAVMGIVWFFAGFRELKLKRIMQDTPTCTIATGAVGTNVEVKGFVVAEKDKLVVAPITGKECAFYHLEIQYVQDPKEDSWVTVDQFFSDEGFYLDDQSGAVALVLVDGAKINHKEEPSEFQISSYDFDQLPKNLATALRANQKKFKKFKLKKTGWFLRKYYRFLEWTFMPDNYLYVLGFADSGVQTPRIKKSNVKLYTQAKRILQKNKKLQKQFDANQDGKLDNKELQRGVKIIAEKLREKYSQEKLEDLTSKTKMIFKHRKPYPFFISNQKEEEMVIHMGKLSALKIWGGPILTAGSLGYLFWYFTPYISWFS